jgi:hypothetical protein
MAIAYIVALIVTVSPVPKVPPQVRATLKGTIDLFAGGVRVLRIPFHSHQDKK